MVWYLKTMGNPSENAMINHNYPVSLLKWQKHEECELFSQPYGVGKKGYPVCSAVLGRLDTAKTGGLLCYINMI